MHLCRCEVCVHLALILWGLGVVFGNTMILAKFLLVVCLSGLILFMESLILAQDERWRRA